MTNSDATRSGGAMDRRTFLKGAAGVAGAAAVGVGASAPAAAQSGFDGWFDDVGNYDGVVDETGTDEVTVEVGAQGNGGGFAFGPPAVRVDPGTTVVWEWTGDGGSHNVVAEDGSFESEMSSEQGHTFEHTFDGEGITKYACTPHKAMGMKGAVVVGSVEVSGAAASSGDGGGDSGGDSGDSADSGSSGSSGSAGDTGGLSLEDTLTVGFAGVLVAGLLGLPVSEMRNRKSER